MCVAIGNKEEFTTLQYRGSGIICIAVGGCVYIKGRSESWGRSCISHRQASFGIKKFRQDCRWIFQANALQFSSTLSAMERLVNKVAIVTGAGSGIGKAVAEQLVQQGLRVVGIALNVDKIKILADEWKSKPGKLIPLQCDLSNENEILRTMEWIEKNLGAVEILVNSAAVDLAAEITEGGLDEWRRCLDVNVLGVVALVKETLRILKKKGLNSGTIVNINDICAWQCQKGGRPVSTGLAVTKHALRGLTENLRLELARAQSNVKVISIVPGLVDTEMSEQSLREKPRLALKPKDVADVVVLAIQTPDSVLIQDLVVTPIRDIVV